MDLTGIKLLECHECKSIIFEEGNMLLTKSKLMTGEAKDSVMPVPVIFCKNCGEILKSMSDDMGDLFALERKS